jgi:hypothetical protein
MGDNHVEETKIVSAIVVIGVLVSLEAMQDRALAQKAAVPKPHDNLALGADEVKQLSLLMDTNKTGKITKQEWMEFMETEFDSEKRAASLGLHSFRHTAATAMDSLGIPQLIRRQRLGHSGNSVTDGYTRTFTEDERNAAEKLGELFGTGWPEIDSGKVISFPNLSQQEEGPVGSSQQALVNQ